MARLLKEAATVLLLDEPTTIWTLNAPCARRRAGRLSAAAAPWSISHDASSLSRILYAHLAFEGDAHVEWFEGGFF